MNKIKAKPSTDEGWAIHFYDGDRRLRFTLEPSHLWTFSWGIGVGLLLAILWSALYSVSHNLSSNTNHSNNPASAPETSSQTEPRSSFFFGID